jgi:hypothetical protein
MKFLILLLLPTLAWARPANIEVWFLSRAKVSQLMEVINKPSTVYRKPTAELQCQEMGEYCFDPQYGLYKKNDASAMIDDNKIVEEKGPTIQSAKSVERDLVDCDPKNYFDIFCGKAKPDVKAAPSKLEVWVDTSSSMHEFDFPGKDGSCHRQSLIKKLDDSCGFNKNVNVMMFDTSIKQVGTIESVCQNQGLNDYKKLMDWIERSDAKNLVIITDIYELHKEFADYIEKHHGKIRGDRDVLTAAQMLDLAAPVGRLCR